MDSVDLGEEVETDETTASDMAGSIEDVTVLDPASAASMAEEMWHPQQPMDDLNTAVVGALSHAMDEVVVAANEMANEMGGHVESTLDDTALDTEQVDSEMDTAVQ